MERLRKRSESAVLALLVVLVLAVGQIPLGAFAFAASQAGAGAADFVAVEDVAGDQGDDPEQLDEQAVEQESDAADPEEDALEPAEQGVALVAMGVAVEAEDEAVAEKTVLTTEEGEKPNLGDEPGEGNPGMPTLTVHWSSIDGVDLVDPLVLNAQEQGDTINQVLSNNNCDFNTMEERFTKAGYDSSGFLTPKPITEYANMDALEAAKINISDGEDDGLVSDVPDLYFVMFKTIPSVEVTVAAPACGTSTAFTPNDEADAAYSGTQSNPPSVSVPEGAHYSVYIEGGVPETRWAKSADSYDIPYEGLFKGGEAYVVSMKLESSYGYCFPNDENYPMSVNGSAALAGGPDGTVCFVVGSVTAAHVPGTAVHEDEVVATCTKGGSYNEVVRCTACKTIISSTPKTSAALGHDWSAWKVEKVATEETEGVEARTCSRCNEKETRAIPKLVATYSGSGDTVYEQGSGESMTFRFTRSIDDESTLNRLKGVKVDGEDVPESGRTATQGSAIITLLPNYLDGLAIGNHEVVAVFDDAESPAVTFAVKAAATSEKKDDSNANQTSGSDSNATSSSSGTASSSSSMAKTGDTLGLVMGMASLVALAMLVLSVHARRRAKILNAKHR